MFCERRRVKYDEIIFLIGHVVEIFESIHCIRLVAWITREVELYIGVGESGCFSRGVYSHYSVCASTHRID